MIKNGDISGSQVHDLDECPLVSVVIPTHRRPKLLARALTSVFSQDYPGPIECLVVFDQEAPYEPAVGIPEQRILRVFANNRNAGLAGARNCGALNATGPLLAFLDDDDEWFPAKLRLQVNALEVNSSADVCGCGVEIHFGERVFNRIPELSTEPFRDLLRSRRMELHPSTLLVKQEVFLTQVGLIDEEIPGSYAEDYDWLLRASRCCRFVFVAQPLVKVFWGKQSHFSQRWGMIIDALQYLLRKHPEFDYEPKGLARIQGQIAFAYAAFGQRRQARSWALRCLSANPWEIRAYLAMLVSCNLLSATSIIQAAHRFGRGV